MIELRDYQKRISEQATELLRSHGICYLSMECRTGKTLTALACAWRYGAKSVLVVTKKKAIASILEDYKLLNPSYAIDVINYESAHKVEKPVVKTIKKKKVTVYSKYDLVILDEAHCLGTFPKPSTRTRTIREICHGVPVIYLSGTPTPESYSQLYHQFWCSSFSPWFKYTNFYKWAKDYVDVKEEMRNGFLVRDYSKAYREMVESDARPLFIDYTQREAGFENRINEHILVVPMSLDTISYLKTIRKKKVLTIGEETILADTPAKLMLKAHQLSSGTVVSENKTYLITDKSKAEYIRMAFANKKIALFYVYQSEAKLLHEFFPDWTDNPEEFQQNDNKTFICHVRKAREGVRLDTADALIFYNLEYSFLSYEQGRNRLISKERKTPAEVYFIVSNCGIERDILEAVRNKTDYTYRWFSGKQNGGLFQ